MGVCCIRTAGINWPKEPEDASDNGCSTQPTLRTPSVAFRQSIVRLRGTGPASNFIGHPCMITSWTSSEGPRPAAFHSATPYSEASSGNLVVLVSSPHPEIIQAREPSEAMPEPPPQPKSRPSPYPREPPPPRDEPPPPLYNVPKCPLVAGRNWYSPMTAIGTKPCVRSCHAALLS